MNSSRINCHQTNIYIYKILRIDIVTTLIMIILISKIKWYDQTTVFIIEKHIKA